MAENVGLFGWPIPEPRDKAGRPEHEPTEISRCKVMIFLAVGKKNPEIAAALGISQPTLRKHYFQELAQRRTARLQLEGQRWAVLYERAIVDKDVPALKEFGRLLDKSNVAAIAEAFGKVETSRPTKVGKKVVAQAAADAVGAGDSAWGDDLVPGVKPN